MDSARPNNLNLLSLKEASERLRVSIDVLLNLNEFNILKPTITNTGQIGYTHDQIDNFLAIQQLSTQNSKADYQKKEISEQAHFLGVESDTAYAQPQISTQLKNDQVKNKPSNTYLRTQNDLHTKKSAYKLSSFLTISAFSFIFFSIVFFPQSQISPTSGSMAQSSQKDTDAGFTSNTSAPEPSQPTTPPSSIRIKNKLVASNNLSNEGSTAFEDKIAKLSGVFEKNVLKNTEADNRDQITDMPLLDANRDETIRSGIKKITSFTSQNTCPSCALREDSGGNSIFDDKGKIKGKPAGGDLLASAPIGSTQLVQGASMSTRSADFTILLIFLALGLLSVIFVLKRQLAYSLNKSHTAGLGYTDLPSKTEHKKILEVDQKTDGTVVLYFRGEEFKVSKPELDSESDQFIARLMELGQYNAKEIDYDTLADEKTRFNTPLSKLVTRLGFVGMKREIFFPRTSKTKVLFRKYITEDDLIAMRLNPEDISVQL